MPFRAYAAWYDAPNLVPSVSHLTAPWSERRETLAQAGHVSPRISSLAPGGGKMRDTGNEVVMHRALYMLILVCTLYKMT